MTEHGAVPSVPSIQNRGCFGFTPDMPFMQASFASGSNDGIGLDNVTYETTAIPLPATALLLISALGGIAACRWI